MGLFCVDHLLTGMDPALVVVYIPSETSLKKNYYFLCKQLVITDSFWVRDSRSGSLVPLSAGTVYGLNLC